MHVNSALILNPATPSQNNLSTVTLDVQLETDMFITLHHRQHIAAGLVNIWTRPGMRPLHELYTTDQEPSADSDLEDIDSDGLEPMQTLWSPLGRDEHEFDNLATSPRTVNFDATSPPPLAARSASSVDWCELLLRCKVPRTSSGPYRVSVTGHFYDSASNAFLVGKQGLRGSFNFQFDLTRSTTWVDFVRIFRRQAVIHKLPSETLPEEWMVVGIVARGWRETSILHRRVAEDIWLSKEKFAEDVRGLRESGWKDLRVVYYFTVKKK